MGTSLSRIFGLPGALSEMWSAGRIFVIKLKRSGNTPEVPRKLEKGLQHKKQAATQVDKVQLRRLLKEM